MKRIERSEKPSGGYEDIGGRRVWVKDISDKPLIEDISVDEASLTAAKDSIQPLTPGLVADETGRLILRQLPNEPSV